MATVEENAARVARGMALLDKERPGWRERIDVAKLDLSSCYACVLGQLAGEYRTGANRLDIHEEDDRPDHNARLLGFWGEGFTPGWRALTRVWRRGLAWWQAEQGREVTIGGAMLRTLDPVQGLSFTPVYGMIGDDEDDSAPDLDTPAATV